MKRTIISIGVLFALLCFLMMVPCYYANAQITVEGQVSDNKGPLPGVSVILKSNNTIGTVTNATGNYRIKVPDNDNDTLFFKAIGYLNQKIPIGGRNLINISMERTVSNLHELVVVGYTTKELSNISSSVAVVSGEQLSGGITSDNVSSLLQGKVGGVVVSSANESDPSGDHNVVIRGIGSISAKSGPLYVVDGIIGDANSVNPNDIQSVTVLKDAAATGLYGSRASNGVIIITTKSGNTGKTKINLNARIGYGRADFGKLKMMNSQELYDYEKTFFPPDVFERQRPESILSTNTNWRKLAYRTARTQDYTLSASGGSENTHFYISGNFFDKEGIMRTTGSRKYTVRTNVSHEFNDKIKLNVKINGYFRKYSRDASGHYGAFDGATINMPFDNPYNPGGTPKKAIDDPDWIGREHDSFLYNWQYNYDRTKQSGISGDADLFYKITPTLTFSSFSRVIYNNSKRVLYYGINSKPGGGTNGRLDNDFINNSTLTTSNRLEYIKDFGVHHLDALIVGEGEKDYLDNAGITAFGLPAGLAVLDVASNLSNSEGNTVETAFSKGLIQVNYNFKNKYFFVGSYINEASSRFGKKHRSGNFYTLAGSWKLDNESFMEDQDAFNLLKLRLSYGSTGNAQIGDYQTLGLYSYAFQYSRFTAAVPSQLANPDLTWEKANTLNLGLDVGLFNRILLNLDLYDKVTNSLLLNAPLPYSSGFSSIFRNIGSIDNKGLEINLKTDNLVGDFKWTTNFNIAFNHNRVTKLFEGKDIITDNQNISVGHDILSWYMRKWAGVDPDNGDPLWEKVSKNGEVLTTNSYNDATLQFVGNASPKFTGGLYNEFTFKRFSLSGFLYFVSGNLVFIDEAAINDGAYVLNNSRVLPSGSTRWQNPGDIATEPKPVYGGNKLSNKPSSRYLKDGSYIRLKNVKLSYELPDEFLSRFRITHASIYISGDNLWTGTSYPGTDPAVSFTPNSGIIGGSGVVSFPMERSILVGININF